MKKVKNEQRKRGNNPKILRLFLWYTGLFCVMCLLVFSIHWKYDLSFIWKNDGWNQHFRALQFYSDWLQEIVRGVMENHRLHIPLWSNLMGYGADIISTLHYYVVGDPLCLLSVFFPDHLMVYCYNGLILLRLYLAGVVFLAFVLYLRTSRAEMIMGGAESLFSGKKRKTEEKETTLSLTTVDLCGLLAGSFVYIFSSYTLSFGLWHPYFLNPFIYLPLVLIGTERVLERKSPVMFILTVFLSAISNFYFFYMIGFNVIFYVLIRLFFGYGLKKWRNIVNRIVEIGIYTVIGTLMSCVIMVPVVRLLSHTERVAQQNAIGLFYPKEFYRGFPMAFSTPSVNIGFHVRMGFSFIAIICVVMLFMQKKKNTQLKAAFVLLTILLGLPMAGKILNGFSYASNRWMFGYIFLVALIIATEWKTLFFGEKKWRWMTAGIILFYEAVLWWSGKHMPEYTEVIGGVGLFLLAGMLLVLCTDLVRKRKIYVTGLSIGLCILVCASISTNSFYRFRGVKKKESLKACKEFVSMERAEKERESAVEKALKEVVKEKKDLFRYAAPENLIERNSSLQSGIPSLHFFWSLAEKYPHDYFRLMNVNNKLDFNYRGMDNRTSLLALAGVKYFVTDEEGKEKVPYGYRKKGEASIDTVRDTKTYTVYENKNSLPFGYTYDKIVTEKMLKKMNVADREQALLQGAFVDKVPDGFPEIELEKKGRELQIERISSENVDWEKGTFHVRKKKGKVTFYLKKGSKRAETGILLSDLSYEGKPRKMSKIRFTLTDQSGKIRGKKLEFMTKYHTRYMGKKDVYVNLGYGEDTVKELTLTFPVKGKYTVKEFRVISHSMDGYEEHVRELKRDVLEEVCIDNNKITGNLSLDKKKILCLPIAYSDGWSAKIDGKKAEVLKVNHMFLGLAVEPGNHQIEFNYWTPGLTMGIILSSAGVILFFVLLVINKRKNSQNVL